MAISPVENAPPAGRGSAPTNRPRRWPAPSDPTEMEPGRNTLAPEDWWLPGRGWSPVFGQSPLWENVLPAASVRPLPIELVRSTGFTLIAATSTRAGLVHAAWTALSGLSGQSEWAFLTELLGALGLWVFDLPASEHHHHRHSFGLWDHSLEVASVMVLNLQQRWRGSGRSSRIRPSEWALWGRVAFALALFHDLGKIQDLVVTAQDDGGVWDPLVEPLLYFRGRHGLGSSGPTPFRYVRGRGPRRHEARAMAILPALLLGAIGDPLRPFLGAALTAYLHRYQVFRGPSPIPIDYLIALFVQADRASSWGAGIAGAGDGGRRAEEEAEWT